MSNYPDGMTAYDFVLAGIDSDVSSELQDRADVLASAKDNVLTAFTAFMAKAGDDLRVLIKAENDAFVGKFPDEAEREAFEYAEAGSPVNDWSDLVDLEIADEYVAAGEKVKHAWEGSYTAALKAAS